MLPRSADGLIHDEQQERAPRQMTVLISAAIIQDGRDGLCRMRNVSESGLNIETALALTLNEPATIALHSGQTLPCVPRWLQDQRVGMSCETDPTAILLEVIRPSEPEIPGPWLPRFSRSMGIEIASKGFVHRCLLDSISIKDVIFTGAPDSVEAGQSLTVSIPYLGSFTATIKVSENGEIFARFATPIGFAELSPWLTAGRWHDLRPNIRRC